MQIIGCPTCGDPLVDSAGSCAKCGETVLSSETTPNFAETALVQGVPLTDIPRTPVLEEALQPQPVQIEAVSKTATSTAEGNGQRVAHGSIETETTIRLPRKVSRHQRAVRQTGEAVVNDPVSSDEDGNEAETTIRLPDQAKRRLREAAPASLETETTLRLPGKARKQQKPRFSRPGIRARLEEDLLSFEDTAYNDSDEEMGPHRDTWHTEVPQKPAPSLPVVAGASARAKHLPRWLSGKAQSHTARSFFWLTTLLLIALLLSGAFGIAVSFGRTSRRDVPKAPPALQVSPATIELGGIVTLRGANFTPGGNVMLSRDQHIVLPDTAGASTIQADAHGLFSDTIVADPAWLAGTHVLYATDTRTHKQAQAPVIVTGESALQGPPHLLLSDGTLDLGSGDEATNANKLLALSNAGGGQATWQASVSQSWLQITPQSGSVASGKHVAVLVTAVRSALAPGTYQASIVFTSSTGQITLPVKLTVTELQASHEAIMQVSPASLAFEGAARGNTPGQRTVTISNPGIQPLVWGANISGAGWLWAAPSSGTIQPGDQQQITVGVNTDGLGTGIYKGTISFANRGSQPVQGSPQSVFVSLTVTPACTLTLSPGSLSFSGVHGETSPAGKTVSVSVAQGCKTSQHWTDAVSTTSGGQWLHASLTKGTTPAKVSISVNTTGLAPGVYKGTLTFTSSLGAKLLSVTLTVTPVPCSVSGTPGLNMQGTAGQSALETQNGVLSTAGDCTDTLNWTSTVSDSSWLSATASGTFIGSTGIKVKANLASLSAGTYNGSVKITVVDSVTSQTVGIVTIPVTLTVQPSAPPANPCTLQSSSSTSLSFSASVGSDPAVPSQSVSISVTGDCTSSIAVTPSQDAASGSWLSLSSPVTISSGSSGTVTISVSSAKLAAGTYTGTVTLTASNGISGSPRTVTVTLIVQ